ncbi:MAG TPA: hypothetical protein VNK04_14660 [Gemmataceae bacterium]|nr:hypothetical protein [Gemmataceae bacterium]
MNRRSIRTIFASLSRKFLDFRPRRPRTVRRRARLEVVPLEERVVPTAVGPDQWWNDGYYNSQGQWVAGTVNLYNNGPGWLEVSGGGGSVAVSPGAPLPWQDEDGNWYSGPEPHAGSYAFEVYGALGDGSGDVTWSGSASSLSIRASGDVNSISIEGDLYVHAGWTIGHLSGRNVSAWAGKSIGNVSASADIGTIFAGTTVGTVSAGGDITVVSAGGNTSVVSAGGWIGMVYAGLDVSGAVSAGTYIGGAYIPEAGDNPEAWYYAVYYGGIWAGRDVVGPVTAGQSIARVSAGRDVLGTVQAHNGDVWTVQAGGGGVYVPTDDPEDPGEGSWVPYAPGRVLGSVTAARDIHGVYATGDVVGAIMAQGGFVGGVNADGNVAGDVTAQTNVGQGTPRDPDPDWRPWGYWSWGYSWYPYWYGLGVYLPRGAGVYAGGTVSGDVTATTGSVTTVWAENGAVSGAVWAAVDVGTVSAGAGVSGAVTAGRDIGSVWAGSYLMDPEGAGTPASVNGSLTAGRDIGLVSATGDVTGAIDAGHGISGVTADGNITGPIRAGAAVGQLDDADHHFAQSQQYWGYGVWAGGSFLGSVTAGTDVSLVKAGGVVAGPIAAGRDVGWVHGTGGVAATITAGRDVGRVYAGGYDFYFPGNALPDIPPASFSGSVNAAGDIYGVFATGDVSGAVTAGGGIADVSAQGAVTGPLTAGDSIGYLGDLVPDEGNDDEDRYRGGGVWGGAEITAVIQAGGDITAVGAGGNLGGSVTAGRDLGTARAGRHLTATLDAGRDIGVLSAGQLANSLGAGPVSEDSGNIIGMATAGRDIGSVTATGNIEATLTAAHAIGGVSAQRSIAGRIAATTGPIGRLTDEPDPAGYSSSPGGGPGKVQAGGDINATIIAGLDITQVEAGRDIAGSITAGRDIGDVSAGRDMSGDLSAGRNIGDVTAGIDDGGSIAGQITAGGNVGDLTAYGFTGQDESPDALPSPATGLDDPELWTIDPESDWYTAASLPEERIARPDIANGGNITQSVRAGGSIGAVTAFGRIDGSLTAGGSIGLASGPYAEGTGVWALEQITGDITAGRGGLTVVSWGRIDGKVTAADELSVWAYEDITGDLSSTAGYVTAGSWDDLSGAVTGYLTVDVRSIQDVGKAGTTTKTITSRTGGVTAWAGGTIYSNLVARQYAAAFAVLTVAGSAESELSDTWIEAKEQDITSQDIQARDLVQLTAGRDIAARYVTSEQGNVVADAGRSVRDVQQVTARKNLWVAARQGSASGQFEATEGWTYVWAFHDIAGGIFAEKTASVTAWNDLQANVTSNDGVDAFAGRNSSGEIQGRSWVDLEARGDITGSVTAGDGQTWAEAVVRAGGTISQNITSTGNADVAATGDITADVKAVEGWLDVVANGNINGNMTAGEEAKVWAGGTAMGSVTSGFDAADVQAGGTIGAAITSSQGDASAWAGGDVSGAVTAKRNAFVEAVGKISGNVKAGADASVVANGDITGSVETEWVADVRSAYGEVSGNVTTRRTREELLTAADSPTKRRIDVIDAEIARLQEALQTASNGQEAQGINQRISELQAERELHQLPEQETNLEYIRAGRVQGMIADGVAKKYRGDPIEGYNTTGYVAFVDVFGNGGYFLLLEPYQIAGRSVVDYDGDIPVYYKVVLQEEIFVNPGETYSGTPSGPLDLKKLRDYYLSDEVVRRKIATVVARKQANNLQPITGAVKFGLHLVPLVGAIDDFLDGNYVEAAISLTGDVTMFLGFGAALKARKCVYAGAKAVKIAALTSTATDGSIAAFRLGQGISAYLHGDQGKAFGYFGDATLRLLGLSAQSIAWLRNKPKCFVAGTLVHTAEGPRPIEQVKAGQLVWAFDRQQGEWRLSRVTRTFRRTSDRLTTVQFADGDALTGTDGHPFWVIEGEELAGRPRGDHGADEPPGPTPGSWVAMAALRVGDVVLTRQGRPTRVVAIATRREAVPVYNIEVAGLHSYAVGDRGVLVHNAENYISGVRNAAKQTAEASKKPTAVVPQAGQAAEHTTPGAAQATATFAPVSGSTKPSTEDPRVIREGWILDGQNPAERPIKWPFNWRKPKDGTWEVHNGRLFFRPNEKLAAVARQYGWVEGDLLPFVKGVPDFQKYAWGQTNFRMSIVLTGDNHDTERIASELAKQGWLGCSTQTAVLKKLSELKLTPHHFQIAEDGTHIIQLVDKRLHRTFRHSGTAQMLREGD